MGDRSEPQDGPPDTAPEGSPYASPAGGRIINRDALNLPNAFTFLRALLVPVILWLLLVSSDGDGPRWWAFGIFVFASLTDTADGWVARRYGTVTDFGKLADPLADKLLVGGALASLAFVSEVPWWAVLVIVAREVAVTVLRTRLVRGLGLVMPASKWGKIKTVTQLIAIGAYLLPVLEGQMPRRILEVAIVLTIWSGIDYAFKAGKLARSARDRKP
jgi:CDP-diacylglycerol--glycerol-3-phosphate 3-phosphatidyltransferase